MMTRKSIFISLLIALALASFACSKSAANMPNEEKHKLFQAANVTQDTPTILQVTKALGLTDADGQPTPAFAQFTQEHLDWLQKNAPWAQEYSDQAKAKEYVKSHMP